MSDIEKQLRAICTYHSDDGTSGYDLSEEQFTQVLALLSAHTNEVLDRIEAELPQITLQEVIEAKVVPTPDEHKKMIWVLNLYEAKVKELIEKYRRTE